MKLIGLQRLVPKDVVGMRCLFKVAARAFVAVHDGAGKGDVVGGVAIAAQRAMPAALHKLKLTRARLAKNCNGLSLAPTAHVVLELQVEAVDPFGIEQPLPNGAHNVLLVIRKKLAANQRLGDEPVVRDMFAEQPVVVFEIPRKTNRLALLGVKGVVQSFHERLRGRLACGEGWHRRSRQGGRAGGLKKTASVD